MKKWGIGFLVLVILGFSGWFINKHYFPKKTIVHPSQAKLVTVGKVRIGNIPISVSTLGTLIPSNTVNISPEIAGQISKIYFKSGEYVKKGQPLVQLDDSIYKAKYQSALANLILYQTNFNRASRLAKLGAQSQQLLDQAKAQLDQQKQLVKELKVTLSKLLLRAPFDGIVGPRNISVGEFVNIGETMLSLVSKENLWVSYKISQNNLAQLKLGQEVLINTSAFPKKIFKGKVIFISPSVNPETRSVSVRALIPNKNRLLSPGLYVNLKQQLGIAKNSLIISKEALVSTIHGNIVYIVENHKAIQKNITIGQRYNKKVQILSGLKKDDVVVLTGQQKLQNGSKVKIVRNK